MINKEERSRENRNVYIEDLGYREDIDKEISRRSTPSRISLFLESYRTL